MKKCRLHIAYSFCPKCGADFNIPKGYVLVRESDMKLLNAAAAWASK